MLAVKLGRQERRRAAKYELKEVSFLPERSGPQLGEHIKLHSYSEAKCRRDFLQYMSTPKIAPFSKTDIQMATGYEKKWTLVNRNANQNHSDLAIPFRLPAIKKTKR